MIARLISLFIISLSCWGIWISELLIHGWNGLVWISYFHYAVPIGILLVILWLTYYTNHDFLSRFKMAALLGVYSTVLYFFYEYCLTWHFIGGPGSLFYINDPYFPIKKYLIFPLLIMTPLSFHYLIGFLSIRQSRKYILLSTAMFITSPRRATPARRHASTPRAAYCSRARMR